MRLFAIGFLFFAAVNPLLASMPAAPGDYTFAAALPTWQQHLPTTTQPLSPTCAVDKASGTVYLLGECVGLAAETAIEFVAIGPNSDRAYESFVVIRDQPSTVAKALTALGMPQGTPPNVQAGLGISKGERLTLSVKRLPEDKTFRPLSDFIIDDFSSEGQSPLTRGFPYVGQLDALDITMPSALIATYTETVSLLGLPLLAPKTTVYGLFRTKTTERQATPVILALTWQRLPEGKVRVYNHAITITPADIAQPDALLTQLKALTEDPRDVFLTVTVTPEVKLSTLAPMAGLLLALEKEGAFTLDVAPKNQLTLRAFNPDPAWNDRSKRTFQPWEIEITPSETPGEPHITLCQILEDWTVEGNDPALTRKCYPGLTAATLPAVMKKVDVNNGAVYVAFFYATPETTMADVGALSTAIAPLTPTQWIYFQAAD